MLSTRYFEKDIHRSVSFFNYIFSDHELSVISTRETSLSIPSTGITQPAPIGLNVHQSHIINWWYDMSIGWARKLPGSDVSYLPRVFVTCTITTVQNLVSPVWWNNSKSIGWRTYIPSIMMDLLQGKIRHENNGQILFSKPLHMRFVCNFTSSYWG